MGTQHFLPSFLLLTVIRQMADKHHAVHTRFKMVGIQI